MNLKIINVIIDKTIIKKDDYPVLNKALTYNIQRIENDSNGNWNYFIITDQGRIAPMRKTARAIRAYNPIHSMYNQSYVKRVFICKKIFGMHFLCNMKAIKFF